MTKEERDQIRKSAAEDHNGSLEAAACSFLDASLEYKHAKGVPIGFEAAVGGIVSEIHTYAGTDVPANTKKAGTTSAKSK